MSALATHYLPLPQRYLPELSANLLPPLLLSLNCLSEVVDSENEKGMNGNGIRSRRSSLARPGEALFSWISFLGSGLGHLAKVLGQGLNMETFSRQFPRFSPSAFSFL